MSSSVVAKFGSFSQEDGQNQSFPTLGRKNGNFSAIIEIRPSQRSSDNSNPQFNDVRDNIDANFRPKKLPVITPGKKNFTIVSKSKSAIEILPQGQLGGAEIFNTAPTSKLSGNTEPNNDTSILNVTFKEYYYQTMAGYSDGRTKTNQDTFYMNMSIKKSTLCSLFAVFDGHGPLGHRVSDFLKKNLTGRFDLQDSFESRFDPAAEYDLGEYTGILEAVCVDINNKLIANKTINSLFSGSTGILVLLHRDVISCANVGDSRAGLFKRSNDDKFILQKLSTDHTPADPKEKDRIIKAGGKVHPCQGILWLIRCDGELYRSAQNLG